MDDIFGNLGFSMGAVETASVSGDRIVELVSAVLKKRFADTPEKQSVIGRPGADRIQCSCPYCGDSRDARKKRGNIYLKWGAFKCYNGGCEKYTTIIGMLEDFDCKSALKDGEETALKVQAIENAASSRVQSRIRSYEANVDTMLSTDFSKVLVPRTELMREARLWEIYGNSPAGVYLRMRGQELDQKFAWDNFKKRIFIFNLDKTGEWIFSLQTTYLERRNYTGSKYLTDHCSSVWSKFMKTAPPEEVAPVNHLSQFFGVLRVNFNAPVTIFEGPMDHFLFPNSVATCGTNFEWPFTLDNDRHFQDNDMAGRKTAMKVLAEGGRVFMWKKFMEDHGIAAGKVKDWNDVVKWEMKTGRSTSVEQYFTDSPMDMIFV